MNDKAPKPQIRYLFVITFLAFVANKNFVRPLVLESDLPTIFNVLVLSFPNFAEAVLGTLVLTRILLLIKTSFGKHFKNVKDSSVHIFSVSIAAVYVITQELKFHNLGGRNVYDPYDLVASVIGLIFIFVVIRRYGLTQES